VPVPGLPRFQGGTVGYLAYDMVRHMERLPATAKDDPAAARRDLPLHRHVSGLRQPPSPALVIANARIEGHDDASLDQAYDRAAFGSA